MFRKAHQPIRLGGYSHIFTDTFGGIFFKNNKICFENDYFLIHGLGKCE